jgi:LacI family transcriptional regulator
MTGAVPPSAPRATRRDVARRAGVSDAVVSYTLNGRAPVAPDTARRVREAIAELGYQPNHAARALKSGSANALAMIAPGGDVFANPFFSEFAHHVEAAAQAHGYALFRTTAAPGLDGVLERARDFVARQVDGLIVVSGDDRQNVRIEGLAVPLVQINASDSIDGVASVGVDLYGGARAATAHLIGHGHRRIAFVGEGPEEPRHRGWRDECAAAGVEAAAHLMSHYTREDGYRAGLELAGLDDRPSAVFVASDRIGLGVLRALHESGIAVPGEVALVSFDGSWEAEWTWPRMTTMRQPIEEMARAAIDALLGTGRAGPAEHQRFDAHLVLGASCGTHSD